MAGESILHAIFLIFTGAAVLATLALMARQALPVAYIALGLILGATGLAPELEFTHQISNIGIMFLLFLLGMDMYPQKLIKLVQESTLVVGLSSAVFAFIGTAVCWAFGFNLVESLLIGTAFMFSSTILGLKLLPATTLHHQHTGELIISLLLLQDVLAILALIGLRSLGAGSGLELFIPLIALPLLAVAAFLISRYLLIPLIARFDQIHEYVFLLALGWCLGFAQLAASLGLSHEIGAFMAGVALASHPVSAFIAQSLRPLRDFFLVMFFVALGAGFDLSVLPDVLLPAVLLAALAVLVKPPVFKWLLRRYGEAHGRSREVGVRLGQISEFSLLIGLVALQENLIGAKASHLIEAATLISFVASTYLIVSRYRTPIAANDKLRRD